MEWNPDDARRWAEEILGQLGAPDGVTLEVTGGDFEDDWWGGLVGPGAAVWLASGTAFSANVCLEAVLTPAEAVALLADRMQDFVLEATCGAALPSCREGHQHPAAVAVSAGTAWWVCPHGGQRLRSVLGAAPG